MAETVTKLTTAQVAALTDEDISALDPQVRSAALTTERAAVKRAEKQGGSIPTPVQDWYKAHEDDEPEAPKTKAKKEKVNRGVTPPYGMIEFRVDGRLLAETQHKLSYIAGYTALGGHDRWSVKQLTEDIVKETGIAAEDLMKTEWQYTLKTNERVVTTKLIPGRTEPVKSRGKKEAEPESEAAPQKSSRSRSRKQAAA